MPTPREVKQKAKRQARQAVKNAKDKHEESIGGNPQKKIERLQDAVGELVKAIDTLADFI